MPAPRLPAPAHAAPHKAPVSATVERHSAPAAIPAPRQTRAAGVIPAVAVQPQHQSNLAPHQKQPASPVQPQHRQPAAPSATAQPTVAAPAAQSAPSPAAQSAPSPADAPSAEAVVAYNEGVRLMRDDPSRAIEKFNQALAAYPSYTKAKQNIARARVNLGNQILERDKQTALRHYREAMTIFKSTGDSSDYEKTRDFYEETMNKRAN